MTIRFNVPQDIGDAIEYEAAARGQTRSEKMRALGLLKSLAALKWGDIEPCSGKSWEECMSRLPDGRWVLYFNTVDHSTHVIIGRPA